MYLYIKGHLTRAALCVRAMYNMVYKITVAKVMNFSDIVPGFIAISSLVHGLADQLNILNVIAGCHMCG